MFSHPNFTDIAISTASRPDRSNRARRQTIGENQEPGSIAGSDRHGNGAGLAGSARRCSSCRIVEPCGRRRSALSRRHPLCHTLGNRPKPIREQDCGSLAPRRCRCIRARGRTHTLTAHPACSTTCSNTSSLSRQATPGRRGGIGGRTTDPMPIPGSRHVSGIAPTIPPYTEIASHDRETKIRRSRPPPNSIFPPSLTTPSSTTAGPERAAEVPAAGRQAGTVRKDPARPRPERRARAERRKRIDPTTFEKQYTEDELEFMNAMQRFKERTGKPFPTYAEVIKVAVDSRIPQAGRFGPALPVRRERPEAPCS